MAFKALQLVILSVELLFSFVGNFTILFLIIRIRNLRNVPNVFLCGLVAANLLNSSINIPLAMDFVVLKTGVLEGGIKPMVVNILLTSMTVLTQHINVLVTGDRFLSIKYNFIYRGWKTIPKALLAIGTVFGVTIFKMSLVHTTRALMSNSHKNLTTTIDYMDSQFEGNGKYLVFLTMVANVITVGLAAILTEREIRKTANKRRHLMESIQVSNKKLSSQITKDIFACRTILFVTIVNTTSYLPSVIISFLYILGLQSSGEQNEFNFFVMIVFSHLSETVSPLAFLIRSKRLCKAIFQIFKCRKQKIRPKTS